LSLVRHVVFDDQLSRIAQISERKGTTSMQRHVLLTFLSPLLVALALTTATAPVHAQTGTKAKVPADPRNDDRKTWDRRQSDWPVPFVSSV